MILKPLLLILILLCGANRLFSQAILRADGPGNTYELINSVLSPGYEAVESPECIHPEFGRHIAEVWDNELNSYVFEFYSHVRPDNDRCINFDRQRVEIKTYEPSPDSLKGTTGDVIVYKWEFRLPGGFQPSSSFTHLHQVKAVGGDDEAPIFTLTARKASPNRMELIHNNGTKVATANLSLFENTWVEATETIKVDSLHGTYSIVIRKVSDGSTILSYSNTNLLTIRYNNTFIRPKWGIYRSLLDSINLRDEAVRFNDFSIAEIASPKPQSITFPPLPVKASGDADFTLNAVASSNLPVTYTSSNPLVAVVVDNQVHIVGNGKTIITASQDGNAAFVPATPVSQTLAVAPFSQILSVVADVYTYGTSPDLNFGKDSILIVKENGTLPFSRKTFLRFNWNSSSFSNLILAKMRIFCNYITLGKVSQITIWSVPDSWTEYGITYNNMPLPTSKLGTFTVIATPAYYELDITPYVVASGKSGSFCLEMTDETSSNALIKFNSREARGAAPELVLAGFSQSDAIDINTQSASKPVVAVSALNHTAILRFGLDTSSAVEAVICSMSGQVLQRLLPLQRLEAGFHQQTTDLSGLRSGCYLMKFRIGLVPYTVKIIIT